MKLFFLALLLFIPLLINDSKQVDQSKQFTEANLISEIKASGIRFQRIVLAQAKLESGRFKSRIFIQNNNLFGMKLAKKRKTLAIDKKNNHAMYKSWIDSVHDFKLWQDAYCSDIKNEKEYLLYLENVYSENSEYVKILKRMI
jgi:hypothetical protein